MHRVWSFWYWCRDLYKLAAPTFRKCATAQQSIKSGVTNSIISRLHQHVQHKSDCNKLIALCENNPRNGFVSNNKSSMNQNNSDDGAICANTIENHSCKVNHWKVLLSLNLEHLPVADDVDYLMLSIYRKLLETHRNSHGLSSTTTNFHIPNRYILNENFKNLNFRRSRFTNLFKVSCIRNFSRLIDFLLRGMSKASPRHSNHFLFSFN